MRTNVDIEDQLMADAMAATGCKTKKETIEKGLQALVQQNRQWEALQSLRGIGWEGDLDAMREDRDFGQYEQ